MADRMKKRWPPINLSLTLGLIHLTAACGTETVSPSKDPAKAEMIAACIEYPSYKRRGPERAARYCSCVYDNTMRGLTEEEQLVARFYLLGQIGINTRERDEYKKMDISVIGTAANAIGEALKRCPGP